MKKYFTDKNFLTAIVFIVLDAFYLGVAFATIPVSDSSSVGAGFMPRVYGFVMMAVAIILLITSVMRINKESAEDTETKAKAMQIAGQDIVRIAVAFIAVLLYVIFLKSLGFIICSIPLLIILVYLLTPAYVMEDALKKSSKAVFYGKIVIFAVVFTFIIYYLFSKGLGLTMPAGVLKNILP